MSRVIVISPHPDDESIGCGGALCAHVEQGESVRVIFLTSGEQGGHGRTPAQTARLREEEAAQAACILGVRDLEFWREPDGALGVRPALIERLRAALGEASPTWLYATHADEQHADHRAAFQLVESAVAGMAAAALPAIRLYEVWTPLQKLDEIVDISEHMEKKLAAVRAYKSQCAVLQFDEAVRGLNRYRGEMHSWPGGDYAEVFAALRM